MIGGWWGAGARKFARAAPGITGRAGSLGAKSTGGTAGGTSPLAVREKGARRIMTGGAAAAGVLTFRKARGSSGVEGVQPHSMGGTTGPGMGGMY